MLTVHPNREGMWEVYSGHLADEDFNRRFGLVLNTVYKFQAVRTLFRLSIPLFASCTNGCYSVYAVFLFIINIL